MMRINVKDMKQAVKDINGIDPFNDVMSFFYDESGNCRKFLLTPNGVNSEDSLKGDFVLAGVAFDGKKKEIDITGLHSALEYRSGQKELKFRHLYNHSKDFLSFMKSSRATDFLHWLKDSDLYIHYSAMNNLFYSITDIVDSLWELFPQQIPLFWKSTGRCACARSPGSVCAFCGRQGRGRRRRRDGARAGARAGCGAVRA